MRTKNTSLSINLFTAIATLIAALILAAPQAFAQGDAPGKKGKDAKQEDKVDISDLENKYWAPKDTDFSVVQNRTYTKENRLFLSLGYGPIINDSYSEGYNFGTSLNYFFNERYGVQLTYIAADLEDNDMVKDLTGFGGGVRPNFGRMTGYYGAGFNWVPFYAKMSFLGQKIIYFDMAITPTLGMTQYDQITVDGGVGKSSFTYGIDITQFFFFYDNIAIRADLKNQWYPEEVAQYQSSGGIATGAKVKDTTNHTTIFLLGIAVYY